MNSKTTKKALLSSVLALVLCVSMLIGTTFAWFTDSVTSGSNNIVAGNLDIELEYWNGTNWKTVNNATDLFSDELWEPGHTEVVYLKLSNLGTLALEYQLGINIVSETLGTNVKGETFRLSQYIEMTVIELDEFAEYADRDAALAAADEIAESEGLEIVSRVIRNGYSANGQLTQKGETVYLAMVVSMPEDVGNEANYLTGTVAPKIELGINLVASQYTYESDSFDNQYDAPAGLVIEATYDWAGTGTSEDPYQIATASDLVGLAEKVNGGEDYKGQYFVLTADIDLNNGEWTPIGTSTNSFKGNFDGQNHIISNLYISGYNSNVGLFGYTQNGSVKNLTVKNASVSGRLNVGVVAGTPYTSTYDNITVTGDVIVNGMSYVGGVFGKNVYANVSNITVNANEGSYVKAVSVENCVSYRSYVGGVIGFMGEGNITVSNVNSNIDVIGSTCDIGGITGIAHYNNTFTNITCTGNVTGLDENENELGGIAGVWHNQNGTTVTLTNCSFSGTITIGSETVSSSLVGPAYSSTGTGTLIIDGKETKVANTQATLDSVLSEGADVVTLGGGEYTIAADKKTGLASDVTIVGNGDTEVNVNGSTGYEGCNYAFENVDSVTFENVTINMPATGDYAGFARTDATFINCEINGTIYLYGKTVFENCTFNTDENRYAVWTYGCGEVTFNNCTFNTDGKAILVYNATATVNVNNCVFNDSNNGSRGKAAISVGADNTNTTYYTINVSNCAINGFAVETEGTSTGTTLYGNKNSMDGDHLKVSASDNTFVDYAIYDADGLVAFAKSVNQDKNSYNGKTVMLMADIDMSGIEWTPIGQTGSTEFQGTFDGNGYTISNLNIVESDSVSNTDGIGLFGWLQGTVKNLTVDNATVKGSLWVGAIVGYLDMNGTVENCTVTNSTIVAYHKSADRCGDKAGAVIGMVGSNKTASVINCSASNCSITAGRDAGYVIGCAYSVNTLTNNTASDCTITKDVSCTDDSAGNNMSGEVIGRYITLS